MVLGNSLPVSMLELRRSRHVGVNLRQPYTLFNHSVTWSGAVRRWSRRKRVGKEIILARCVFQDKRQQNGCCVGKKNRRKRLASRNEKWLAGDRLDRCKTYARERGLNV